MATYIATVMTKDFGVQFFKVGAKSPNSARQYVASFIAEATRWDKSTPFFVELLTDRKRIAIDLGTVDTENDLRMLWWRRDKGSFANYRLQASIEETVIQKFSVLAAQKELLETVQRALPHIGELRD